MSAAFAKHVTQDDSLKPIAQCRWYRVALRTGWQVRALEVECFAATEQGALNLAHRILESSGGRIRNVVREQVTEVRE